MIITEKQRKAKNGDVFDNDHLHLRKLRIPPEIIRYKLENSKVATNQ